MSLPKGWAVTSMGDIRVDSGSSIDPRQHPSTEFVLYSVPQFDTKTPEILKGSEIGSSKQTVAPDTVLLCKINPRINRVWVVELQTAGTVIASTEWIPFFKVPGIKPKYLAYFLQQNEIRTYLAQNVSGVGGSLMRVRPAVVDRLEFKLAPEPEQDRIVAEIEKQFTRLDDAVAALKRVQAHLKRYRASVLKAACEGRLVSTEAELARKEGRDYEPASELLKRILAERHAKWEADQLQKMIAAGKPPKSNEWKTKYKEPTPPDSSELPALPEGWVWSSFEQVISFGPQNGLYKPATAYGKGTRIVRIDDYQDHSFKTPEELRVLELSSVESSVYGLSAGDILVNRVNSPSHLGKAAVISDVIVGSVFESNMMRLRVADSIDPRFIMFYLMSVDGRQRLISNAKWAVNQASINQTDVQQTPVPLPPAAEQKRVVAEIDRRLSTVAHVLSQFDTELSASSRLRASILEAAFSGKLVPQDPNDEPAAVLLERIRAERARAQAQNGKATKAINAAPPINGQRRAAIARDGVGRRANKLAQPAKAGKG